MIERIREYIKSFIDIPEFYDYFTKPINEGIHYHIGGISELIDITTDLSDEAIEDIISERSVKVNEDLFTIQYLCDIDEEGDVITKYFHSILISLHKISSNFLLISGFYLDDTEAAVNPVITIIPLGEYTFNPHDDNFVENLKFGICISGDIYLPESLLKDSESPNPPSSMWYMVYTIDGYPEK